MRATCDETLVFPKAEMNRQSVPVQREFLYGQTLLQSHADAISRLLGISPAIAGAMIAPGFCVAAGFEEGEWQKGLLSAEGIPLSMVLTLLREYQR